MQLLTLKNLKNYNLFSDTSNNLIYTALLISKSELKINLKNPLPQNPLIQVYNHKNEQIFVSEIISLAEENIVLLKGNFKPDENYYVKINNEPANVILNPEIDGILDTDFYYEDTDFGVHFSDDKIHFKLWSPPAINVELLLCDEK